MTNYLHPVAVDVLKRRGLRALALVVAIVCAFVDVGWSQGTGPGGKRDIEVATVNLYVGADFTPLAALDPADPLFPQKLQLALVTTYGRIIASNFPKRADALAREIVARGTDMVALQEVSLIQRQSFDGITGNPIPGAGLEIDYLQILLAALARHGGHYQAVSSVDDIDVQVPLVTGATTFDLVRLLDRDVIIARTDLPPGHLRVSNPQDANYAVALPLPIGVDVLRGWCSIDVEGRGRKFRLVNTHIEDALPVPAIQALQVAELIGTLSDVTLPVVLAGDFNSDANGLYSPLAYLALTTAGGFSDAWRVVHPGNPGLTWGHDEFLANPAVPFLFRLDMVLYRGAGLEATAAEVVSPVIGAPPPLWFSDHAGVFANLAIH